MKTKSILIFSSASIASLFGTQLGAALLPVDLGTSADYVVLAKTAITTTSGTAIVGDLSISPNTLADVTGFGQTLSSRLMGKGIQLPSGYSR